ncbi:MAG TPA: SRPBCC domain-containing protein [Galbitalea sp.]|jgi:uncharacterized protein YndB with AHSA1/START domain|nr:SRPBCC domain-containing protein [Galbitalea sp.]
MPKNLIATAGVTVNASPERVWAALTDPAQIRQYMFGSDVTSDWTVGSPITYAGEYEGKRYEDYGEILEIMPPERLRTTHFSPLSKQPDAPENYHTITYTLERSGGATRLELTQDNNHSEEEVRHSASHWQQALETLRSVVESTP